MKVKCLIGKEFGFHLVIYSKGVKARRCPMQSQAIAIATIFFAEDHGVSTTWNNRLSRFSSHRPSYGFNRIMYLRGNRTPKPIRK